MGAVRSRLLRDQSSEAIPFECGLGLIERRPRQPGFVSGAADRDLFGFDSSQHLVLDLDQVVGIEEAAVLKQSGGDRFGVGMQNALFAEEAAFGIASVHL